MQKESGNTLTFVVIIVFIFILLGIGAWYMVNNKSAKATIPSSNAISQSIPGSQDFFDIVDYKFPSANWTSPATAEEQTLYGNISGEQIGGEVDSKKAQIPHFENEKSLKNMGFEPDLNLSADGPGSSSWGYKKTADAMTQIAIFSYTTKASATPGNEPIQFNCPCKVSVSAFISTPFEIKQ